MCIRDRTKTVRLALAAKDLAHWDVTRSKWVVESSDYDVMVGSSASDVRVRSTLVVRGQTIPARDLTKLIRAENFDAYSGAKLTDESKAHGTAVDAVAGGYWIKFADAQLGAGATSFTASAAKADGGEGAIQIRLDSPTGPLVGTASIASTGSVYTYAPTSTAIRGASGRHDVYLVFSSGMRLVT